MTGPSWGRGSRFDIGARFYPGRSRAGSVALHAGNERLPDGPQSCMLRDVKRSLSFALTLTAGLFAGCGGGKQSTSGGAGSGGLPLTPGVYYNLMPGTCAEYSNDAGGTGPTVGVHIQTAVSPPGIELRRTKHGVMDE